MFTHGTISPGGVITPEAAKSKSSNRVTGKVGLDYTFDSGAMVFANYSRGYRAGSFASQFYGGNPIDFVPPEKVDAFELGTKARLLDNRVNVTAAVFLTKYKNQQLNEVIGTTGFIRSAPGSTIKGLELEVNTRLIPTLKTNFALTLLDATYDKLTLSGVVLDGNQLPNAPKVTINAGADWTVAPLGSGEIVFSPNLIYTSKQFFSPFNGRAGNTNLNTPGNVRVNATLGWESEKLAIRFWTTNLFNKKLFMYGLNLRDAFGYDYMLQAPPRSYGVTVKYNF